MRLSWILLVAACLVGCSSSSSTDKQSRTAAAAPVANHGSNPVAKYVELVGFRVKEKGQGHLIVEFGVVNHSEADIGDLQMTVNLVTTAAKPGDPPLVTFPTKIPALGPQELKQVTVDVPAKMRVYELPDWQFLRADFQITEPK
jgi:hypothetical protein